MYSNKNNNYYHINHERNLDFFDTSLLAQLKSLLFCELAENDTANISKNIIILFNSILKYNNLKDKFELINNISEQCHKNTNDDSLSLCQKVSKKNFQMSFELSKENITDISILLSIGIKKMNRENKIKNKVNLSYDKFIGIIGKYKNMRLNMIPFYKNYNTSNNKLMNNNNNDIPNEILLLIDIFQKIKKLEFKIDDYDKNKIFCISLILLNYEWLFPYVFEIEFDLNCDLLNKETQKAYIKKIREKIGFPQKNEAKNNNNLNDEEEENDINNIDDDNNIKNYGNIIDSIIIYTFFVDKFKFLNNLKIKIPDSFKIEIEKHLKIQKLNINNPHPLKFFFSINNLLFLEIEFNALDSFTFEYIFALIQNNSNLKHLSLNFFPNENNNFNTLSNLLKLAEESISGNFLLQTKIKKSKNNNYNENKKELKKILLDLLIENFENNMEKLFILLQTKKNLEELFLFFNEPNLFAIDNDDNNNDYYYVLLKFIYNILIMINKDTFILKYIKIISKYFLFDSGENKNNFIDKFLNRFNLNENNKNLIDFQFQLKMNNITNISHFISFNLKKLHLGDFDKNTLCNFISFYQEKKFIQKSELFSLIIELNDSISSYAECKEELVKLIKSECPQKLKEIGLFCKFNINENDLADLVLNGNGNSIHKYIFQIKGNNKDKNKYDQIINDKKIYYMDNNYSKSVNKYIPLIIKYKFHTKDRIKIGQKLIQFLVISNRKHIEIFFI